MDVFTVRQLQDAKNLLHLLADKGRQTVADALMNVDAEITKRIASIHRSGGIAERKERQAKICPDCGKPVGKINVDGFGIFVCRACRWSTPVGGA